MANELSSMPAETFALNLMGVDMRSDDFVATRPSDRPVLWLDPVSDDMDKRLADNPFERPETDMSEVADAGDLTGRLVVGDIRRLNDLADRLGHPLIKGDVDLVSGGPPCQSSSLAGRREFGNQRNQLPFEFARFVERQRPRMVLLENVEGILRPFKLEDRTYYAWFEVCKAFASIGYATRPLLINARNCGVAQNRPRFVMLAVRMDLAMFLSAPTATLFAQGMRLINAVGPVRRLLAETEVYDYAEHPKGSEKTYLDGYLFSYGQERRAPVSLYRPTTKDGDPRIWMSGIKGRVDPFDLLIVTTDGSPVFPVLSFAGGTLLPIGMFMLGHPGMERMGAMLTGMGVGLNLLASLMERHDA